MALLSSAQKESIKELQAEVDRLASEADSMAAARAQLSSAQKESIAGLQAEVDRLSAEASEAARLAAEGASEAAANPKL